jgi:hypothetical protein
LPSRVAVRTAVFASHRDAPPFPIPFPDAAAVSAGPLPQQPLVSSVPLPVVSSLCPPNAGMPIPLASVPGFGGPVLPAVAGCHSVPLVAAPSASVRLTTPSVVAAPSQSVFGCPSLPGMGMHLQSSSAPEPCGSVPLDRPMVGSHLGSAVPFPAASALDLTSPPPSHTSPSPVPSLLRSSVPQPPSPPPYAALDGAEEDMRC